MGNPLESLTHVVSDLSRHMPAEKRYRRLLEALREIFPCDAVALLRLEDDVLRPLAVDGLSRDTLGRRFRIEEHPRLSRIVSAREPVRFAHDCGLPDPYDGLVEGMGDQFQVHDCMGAALYIDERVWGVLTMEALDPHRFDRIDGRELRAFIALAAATVKAANLIAALAERVERGHEVNRQLMGDGSAEMIGDSAVMRDLAGEIHVVADSELTVLILGETGVGKELVAKAIHTSSRRAAEPLVYVNCAALPETVAESELFGHVRGAFSGAMANRRGKFELAHHGTLFLDEIGEMPLSIQAKLLRSLQSGEIQRVGSDEHIEVDVRIIAATNRDLQQEVAQGRFRADLFHRLSVYPLKVPPLRERGEDVLRLAGYFLEQNRARLGYRGLRLTSDVESALLRYGWPGNVRELEHVISRAALKAVAAQHGRGGVVSIALGDLGLDLSEERQLASGSASVSDKAPAVDMRMLPLREAVEQFQRELIERALAEHDDNWTAAAQVLGMDRSNLHRLGQRLGIQRAREGGRKRSHSPHKGPQRLTGDDASGET